MVVPTRTCASDTSTSSDLDELSLEEKKLQLFSKQMLNGRRFKGTFQEKRYVESLNAYRDVVCLAGEEEELIQDILAVKHKIDDLYPSSHWIGITTPDIVGAPAAYSLWVDLPKNTTFGAYCFKIKRVKFSDKETRLRIQVIYPLNEDMHRIDEKKEHLYSDANTSSSDILTNIKQDINEKLHYLLQNIATLSNLRETIKFLFMLLATITVFLFEILKYFSEFLLKFMNEFSNFMKSAAPIFQILANLVERLFRTLCMLVAFLIKGGSPSPTPPTSNLYLQRRYIPYQNMRALPASPKTHDVIIEEIE